MTKHIVVFFVFAAIIGLNSYCYSQSPNGYFERKLEVRITPINLIDPVSSVLQLGLQKRFTNRLALSMDHGFKVNYFYAPMDRQNYRYSKSKIELKYFLALKRKTPGSEDFPYVAVEGFYFPQKYRKENEWLYRDGKSYQYEYSNINRKVIVGSFKLGMESWISKRWTIDNYIGMGIRKMTINQKAFGEVESIYYEPVDVAFRSSVDWKDGVYYRPHISLGFKLGYLIKM